ncbi:DUF397 domain-containing protein [Streptomyces sp. SID14478]|uniref:DUF397 domain-containing protein n=1 Tax=Streptomyces sp. SID14478 TaxID=2706073 RepID=UPI0013DC49F0|nr:DUF397 domain-containing protein [Streptomyces sp. SID14478]NEB73864.1 DUF397 domain-containing protein [Streptomyces sp. SID14478]
MSTAELHWFKSSYSSSNEPGDCVEVALEWVKSSYSSGPESDDCVEVATTPTTIHLRDSKNPTGPRFTTSPEAWRSFTAYAAEGAVTAAN